ncbi:MAG: hypothetical protein GY832_34800 [Chloroflexi bacterium]|nr:hypothetical protein [Chloroflexota bacterium]
MSQNSQFRLMTYNIRGKMGDLDSALDGVVQVIQDVAPDVLVIQEAAEFQDADSVWHSDLDQIAQALDIGKHVHFGPTVSMREHLNVQQPLFVQGIFNDWQDWRKGNAILSRWEFVRLGDPSKAGVPKSVPLYQTPLYRGNRDTEARHALLARINRAPIYPFVVGVHLTTLVAERKKQGNPASLPDKTEKAQILRFKQARRLLHLLREHVLEREEMVFLLGDFNTVASEPCISSVLQREGGFVHLMPTRGPGITHLQVSEPIDHIFVYPRDRLVEYQCWIVDNPVARQASDHLPVVTDVTIK